MYIYKNYPQVLKTILAVGVMLILTACKQDFILLDADNTAVGNGILEVSANSPYPVHVKINDREFSGNWKSTRVYEAAEAKRHRLLGSRSYGEYMQGNARDQLKHGQANLTDQNGTEMVCDFYYRGQPKSGSCNLDGTVLKLVVPTLENENNP